MTIFKIKKQKTQKRCIIERKLKFENRKSRKNEISIDSLKKDHKEFIKTKKMILKA